jgi:membrane protein YdbS with pleckstrin-like domain
MPLPRKLLNDDEELLVEMRPHWVFYGGPFAATAAAWVAVLALLIGVKPPSWASYPLLAIAAVPTIWLAGRLIRWQSYTLALTTTRILVRQGVFGRDTIQLRLQRITEVNLAQTLTERLLGTGRLVIDVQGEDDSLILEDVRKPAILQRVVNSQINELVGGGAREEIPDTFRPRDAPRYRDVRDEFDEHGHHDDHEHHDHDTPPLGNEPVLPEPWGTGAGATDSVTPTPQPGSTDRDIHERLIALDDLRRRGILTEEEFQAKKAQLLDRI